MHKKKNILFYFYENQGLGHLSHFRFLYDSLKKDNNLLVFCHGEFAKNLLGDMNLYIFPDTGFSQREYIDQRIQIIGEKLGDFSPDLFLIDFYPFGKIQLRYEIDSIIKIVKQNQGKIYTFMRDILYGQSFFTPEKYQELYKNFELIYKLQIQSSLLENQDTVLKHLSEGTQNKMFRINLFLDFYLRENIIDGVIVFGDSHIHKIESECVLRKEEKEKFIYFGYLAKKIGERNFIKTQVKKVVVSTGGGLTSEKQFLKLLSTLSRVPNISVDIYIGTFVREEYKDLLMQYFQEIGFFKFLDFSPNFSQKLERYDIYFGCGGYGIFLDLLESAIPAYIIPNYNQHQFSTRKYEQENRVKLFRDSMNIFLLGEYRVQDIIKSIFRTYSSKKPILRLAKERECLRFFENI